MLAFHVPSLANLTGDVRFALRLGRIDLPRRPLPCLRLLGWSPSKSAPSDVEFTGAEGGKGER